MTIFESNIRFIKTILRHTIIIYLAAFMLLASVSIPYATMTCLISNETTLSLMVPQEDCSLNASSSQSTSIQKDTCCLFSKGIIETNVELIQASFHTLAAFIAPKEFILIPNLAMYTIDLNLNLNLTFDRPPDIPIRILQQSFLC